VIHVLSVNQDRTARWAIAALREKPRYLKWQNVLKLTKGDRSLNWNLSQYDHYNLFKICFFRHDRTSFE